MKGQLALALSKEVEADGSQVEGRGTVYSSEWRKDVATN